MEKIEVKEAKGKLGILVVGVGGAVSTTMITGTLAARKGVETNRLNRPDGDYAIGKRRRESNQRHCAFG